MVIWFYVLLQEDLHVVHKGCGTYYRGLVDMTPEADAMFNTRNGAYLESCRDVSNLSYTFLWKTGEAIFCHKFTNVGERDIAFSLTYWVCVIMVNLDLNVL